MATLTGQQLATDQFIFNNGEPDVTELFYSSGDSLYRYDYSTRTSTLVGVGGGVFFDIAINPNGDMFGIINGQLCSVNTTNASSTIIGFVGGLNSLTFDANGVMYSVDGTSLVTVNTTDASKTVVGELGVSSMGDVVFFNNTLYLAASDGTLVKYTDLDDLVGSRVVIGQLPFQMFGLAQLKVNDTSRLIGVTEDFRVCDINPETAACTNVVQFSANTQTEYFFGGATSQCWGRPLSKVAPLFPAIKVPDNTVAAITVNLLGRDMTTNDVYTSSRVLRIKNLDEFYVNTLNTYSAIGEGTLPSNLVVLHYLADQTSFIIQVVTQSPNTVKWTATIIKTTD